MGLRIAPLSLMAALAVALLAACGGSGSASSGSSSSTPKATPRPATVTITETEFSLSPSTLNLKPGTYDFRLQDTGKLPHDLHIEGPGDQDVAGTTSVMQPGGGASFTATLKQGTYTMYCAVDSHRARGMQGTIQVSGS